MIQVPISICFFSPFPVVCRNWYQLTSANSLWQRLSLMPPWQLSPAEGKEQLERRMASDDVVDWKRVFRERYKLRRCWLNGQCHVRTFEGHTGGISCVQFDSSRIVSGSHDKTIRVWNIKTNSPWEAFNSLVSRLNLHFNVTI